jgi:hypothetical protein
MEEKLERIRKFAKGLMFSDEITTEGSIGEELMDILYDNQFKYPKVYFNHYDDGKKIVAELHIEDNKGKFLVNHRAEQKYDFAIGEELKKELITDMKDKLFKEAGKQFLEMAMERE